MYILYTQKNASTYYICIHLYILYNMHTERDGEASLELHRHVRLRHAYVFTCTRYIFV